MLNRFQQFLQGSPEPVEPDYAEAVSCSGKVNQAGQPGALELFARDDIFKDPDGSCVIQTFGLR